MIMVYHNVKNIFLTFSFTKVVSLLSLKSKYSANDTLVVTIVQYNRLLQNISVSYTKKVSRLVLNLNISG